MTAKTLFDKVWERHVVVPESTDTPAVLYVDLHLTHEVTSPQAFDVLRSRGLKVRRLDRTLATMDHSTPTDTAQIFGGVPIKLESAARQVRQLEVNCAEFGVEPDRPEGRPARHRAHHRAGARRHAAGQDDRLRRQPHQHARRVRRPRVRHRHHGGGLRARDAVPAAAQAEVVRDRRGRAAAGRRHREGPGARDHRPDRRQRRHRPRDRVSRPGDRGAVDGRAHDRLQHVDRSRRPCRHDRAGRDDVRVSRRAVRSRRRARTGIAPSPSGSCCGPMPAPDSTSR